MAAGWEDIPGFYHCKQRKQCREEQPSNQKSNESSKKELSRSEREIFNFILYLKLTYNPENSKTTSSNNHNHSPITFLTDLRIIG